MTVVNLWANALSPAEVQVAAKVDTGVSAVRLAVADNPGMSGPVFSSPQSPTAQDMVKLTVDSLDPDTRYWYRLETDSALDGPVGTVLTHPPLGVPGRVRFWAATCAGGNSTESAQFPGVPGTLVPHRISNHPVHQAIASQAAQNDLLFGWHGGDRGYYDLGSGSHGIAGGASLDNYRRQFDDSLLQPTQQALHLAASTWYSYDDHDGGPNNHDAGFDASNAQQVYREKVPHFALPATGSYFDARIARYHFVALDVRTFRDPNSDPDGPDKTMLGAAQMAWLESIVANSPAEWIVVLCPERLRWNSGTTSDSWSSFAHERDQVVEMFGDHGRLGRNLWLCGDAHNLGIDSGTMPDRPFAQMQVAPLDSGPSSALPAVFDTFAAGGLRGGYGLVDLRDLGTAVTVHGSVHSMGTSLAETQWSVSLDPPPPSVGTVEQFAEVVSGSHRVLIEAIVVDGFQTGWEPTGTPLEVLGGDVQYDANASIFATLELDVAGVDEAGASLFPRRPDMLLAPYGTEVFVRRGVDLGGAGVLWSPLGYFQIRTPEQDDSPYGTIRISGQDRDAGLAEARALTPRVFDASRTVGSVVAEIVGEVYPEAVVLFDDDTAFQALGRTVVLEEDRVPVLRELADSYGKIVFWDGEGILRFESPPDEDTISWDIRAGVNGVLVTSGRRVTRDGVFNGVRATGEGDEGDEDQVMAVAIDSGPNSPTRWAPISEGGFGFVPRFYASPLISTEGQALAAARTMLSRELGAPYSVDFGTVVNPALRPYHRVRITQQDGNRERHIVDRCTVPLSEDTTMTGATREVTQAVIGALIT